MQEITSNLKFRGKDNRHPGTHSSTYNIFHKPPLPLKGCCIKWASRGSPRALWL